LLEERFGGLRELSRWGKIGGKLHCVAYFQDYDKRERRWVYAGGAFARAPMKLPWWHYLLPTEDMMNITALRPAEFTRSCDGIARRTEDSVELGARPEVCAVMDAETLYRAWEAESKEDLTVEATQEKARRSEYCRRLEEQRTARRRERGLARPGPWTEEEAARQLKCYKEIAASGVDPRAKDRGERQA
jgi:hypothetical protein